MLNWIVRNRTVWHLTVSTYKMVFTNHIFNINVKTGFGIE